MSMAHIFAVSIGLWIIVALALSYVVSRAKPARRLTSMPPVAPASGPSRTGMKAAVQRFSEKGLWFVTTRRSLAALRFDPSASSRGILRAGQGSTAAGIGEDFTGTVTLSQSKPSSGTTLDPNLTS